MIVKPFEPSSYKLAVEALSRRLDPHHPLQEKLSNDFKAFDAGDYGEKYIMDLLQTMRLPEDARIFHNIVINRYQEIQMDIIIMTNSYIVVLEVKNMKGEIYFEQNPRQLIRKRDTGQVDIYTSPELQLDHSLETISDVLHSYQLQIPIIGVIVFPFQNARIITSPKKYPLVFGHELSYYLKTNLPGSTNTFINPPVDILLNNHITKKTNSLCSKLNIGTDELTKGVFCPQCGMPYMRKIKRTWECESCHGRVANAHLQALLEYRMLVSDFMSNSECRQFLLLQNASEAKRILQNVSLASLGAGKRTIYELP